MQREIDILRATEESFRKKVLELELDNDDLERTERQVFVLFTPPPFFLHARMNWFLSLTVFRIRAATSSLTDLEMKLNKAIERNAILEHEIAAKDNLTEQTQRLKDELNGNLFIPWVKSILIYIHQQRSIRNYLSLAHRKQNKENLSANWKTSWRNWKRRIDINWLWTTDLPLLILILITLVKVVFRATHLPQIQSRWCRTWWAVLE